GRRLGDRCGGSGFLVKPRILQTTTVYYTQSIFYRSQSCESKSRISVKKNMYLNTLKPCSFIDMCIAEVCFSRGNMEQTVQVLYNFGYRTIAINYTLEDGNIESKRKKKKGESRDTSDMVPPPRITDGVKDIVSKLKLENFEVLSRLTITFSNQEILHKINKSLNFKKYDIIAVLPTTMQAFMFICSTFEADIFAVDLESKFSLRLTRKLYHQLVERGYHFELNYGPAIQDSTKRKNLIHISHLYHSFGKSKNIILSSGAESNICIRSPYDVISLGFIFGLSELQSKHALTSCPRSAIINSVGRKYGKSVMFVENIRVEDKQDVVVLEESEGEDMTLDQPVQKKSKV
ncbi:hypothetical protein NQ315_013216, partial [Exocentrus adspersus]